MTHANFPGPSAEHPILTCSPFSDTLPAAAAEEDLLAAPARTLPLALLWEDGLWKRYSHHANVFHDEARIAGHSDVIWLATAAGVKCVDQARGRVRHETEREGLPGDDVIQIAATATGVVWCLVATPPVEPSRPATVTLCRRDEASGRWRAQGRALPAPVPRGSASGTERPLGGVPLPRAWLVTGDGDAWVVPTIAPLDENTACFRCDGHTGAWRDVAWDEQFRLPGDYLPDERRLLRGRHSSGEERYVTWAHVDEVGRLWLATNRGLFCHDPATGRWQRFLDGRVLTAGVAAGEDVFWLAEQARDPVQPARRAPTGPARLVRFDVATGPAREWSPPAPAAGENGGYQLHPFSPITRLVIVPSDSGAVWGVVHGDLAPSAAFVRFDPQAENWQRITPGGGTMSRSTAPTADFAAVPDAVIRAAALLAGAQTNTPLLPPRVVAARFPFWFCPPPSYPVPPEAASAWDWPDFRPRLVDKQGVAWQADVDNRTLLRTNPAGQSERIGPPSITFAAKPSTLSVAATSDGNVLLVASSHGLHALDQTTGRWRAVLRSSDPPLVSYSSYFVRLETRNRVAYVGGEHGALRYDVATGETRLLARGRGENRRLLGVARDGTIWLRDGGQGQPTDKPVDTLLRVNGSSGGTEEQTPIPIPIAGRPALPGEISAGADAATMNIRFVWAHEHTVWALVTVRGPANRANTPTFLAGYDTQARTWTAPSPRLTSAFVRPSFLTDPESATTVYVAANGIWRYDARTNRWTPGAPPLPDSEGNGDIALVSLDRKHLWAVNVREPTLWELDRAAETWTPRRAPVPQGEFSANPAIRINANTFFVATWDGLWRFDAAKEAWRSVPIPVDNPPTLRDLALSDDGAYLWTQAAGGSGQTVAARLDTRTRTWQTFGADQGYPQHDQSYSLVLVADGNDAWSSTSSGVFRFDASAGRWENVTRGVFAAPDHAARGFGAVAQKIVPDGLAQVWILTSRILFETRPDGPTGTRTRMVHVTPAPLLRYDRAGRAVRPVVLPAADNREEARGTSLLVEADRLYLGTTQGTFRIEKNTLRAAPSLPVPVVPFGDNGQNYGGGRNLDGPTNTPHRIARASDGALWLAVGGSLLRWSELEERRFDLHGDAAGGDRQSYGSTRPARAG